MRQTDIQDKDIPTAEPGELIIQYTPLIYKIAQRYKWVLERTCAVDIDDLLQAGRIAIYNAQRTYDPESGASFLSYIFDRIRSAMRRTAGIAHGEAPDIILSLDAPISEESDTRRGDLVPDNTPTAEENAVEQESQQETVDAVRAAVDRIKSDRQREVIRRVWLDGQEREAAAVDMGMNYKALCALDKAGREGLRRDQQLQQYAVPFFHVTISRFNSTWTSSVEMAVIWMEERRRIEQDEPPSREWSDKQKLSQMRRMIKVQNKKSDCENISKT